MNHIERFFATIERRPVDRPCTWLGVPSGENIQALFSLHHVQDFASLADRLGLDIWHVPLPLRKTFDWRKDKTVASHTLNTVGFFQGCRDLKALDSFDWPKPEECITAEDCINVVKAVPEGFAILGMLWSPHFQDVCSAFGMEDAMVAMLEAPELYREIIQRILKFYLAVNEVFYEATAGSIHAILIGNDFGTQKNLMIAPRYLREFVFDGTRQLVQQAKKVGLKVFHHSCGAIRSVIPDLIEMGVDVIHPIQARAAGMEAAGLKNDFGDKISFCGGVDVQQLLVWGTPDEVRREVRRLRGIFPTGLIFSPSHEGILPDVSAENLTALFQETASLSG